MAASYRDFPLQSPLPSGAECPRRALCGAGGSVYEYQKYGRYFAQCAHAMEELVADELVELGATKPVPKYRGVYFEADPEAFYRINYRSRLVNRILAPIITFQCHSDRYLYKTAGKIDWSEFLGVDQSLVINANASDSNVNHSQYATQRLKDAIVDQFRERTGKRPSIDRLNADVWLNLSIHKNRAIISLDASGGSLHRRGYRLDAREAPLQETLGAAIIRLSGWRGETPLVDPMCGSGTLLAEALLAAGNVPASWLRMADKTPVATLPDFDAGLWQRIKDEAAAEIKPLPTDLVSGSDLSTQALDAARANLARLPGSPKPKLTRQDFRTIKSLENVTIITNPPYGRRIGDKGEIVKLYREFGDFLKQRCTNSTAWILCGDMELVKSIGLRTKQRIPLYNGQLECRLVEVPVY
ncbi:MAG: class I SAM-dependent RNA methyltransferase [bacterium]|nr:class I SAM-dependent RNA methyltransferase [bacterium]